MLWDTCSQYRWAWIVLSLTGLVCSGSVVWPPCHFSGTTVPDAVVAFRPVGIRWRLAYRAVVSGECSVSVRIGRSSWLWGVAYRWCCGDAARVSGT